MTDLRSAFRSDPHQLFPRGSIYVDCLHIGQSRRVIHGAESGHTSLVPGPVAPQRMRQCMCAHITAGQRLKVTHSLTHSLSYTYDMTQGRKVNRTVATATDRKEMKELGAAYDMYMPWIAVSVEREAWILTLSTGRAVQVHMPLGAAVELEAAGFAIVAGHLS